MSCKESTSYASEMDRSEMLSSSELHDLHSSPATDEGEQQKNNSSTSFVCSRCATCPTETVPKRVDSGLEDVDILDLGEFSLDDECSWLSSKSSVISEADQASISPLAWVRGEFDVSSTDSERSDRIQSLNVTLRWASMNLQSQRASQSLSLYGSALSPPLSSLSAQNKVDSCVQTQSSSVSTSTDEKDLQSLSEYRDGSNRRSDPPVCSACNGESQTPSNEFISEQILSDNNNSVVNNNNSANLKMVPHNDAATDSDNVFNVRRESNSGRVANFNSGTFTRMPKRQIKKPVQHSQSNSTPTVIGEMSANKEGVSDDSLMTSSECGEAQQSVQSCDNESIASLSSPLCSDSTIPSIISICSDMSRPTTTVDRPLNLPGNQSTSIDDICRDDMRWAVTKPTCSSTEVCLPGLIVVKASTASDGISKQTLPIFPSLQFSASSTIIESSELSVSAYPGGRIRRRTSSDCGLSGCREKSQHASLPNLLQTVYFISSHSAGPPQGIVDDINDINGVVLRRKITSVDVTGQSSDTPAHKDENVNAFDKVSAVGIDGNKHSDMQPIADRDGRSMTYAKLDTRLSDTTLLSTVTVISSIASEGTVENEVLRKTVTFTSNDHESSELPEPSAIHRQRPLEKSLHARRSFEILRPQKMAEPSASQMRSAPSSDAQQTEEVQHQHVVPVSRLRPRSVSRPEPKVLPNQPNTVTADISTPSNNKPPTSASRQQRSFSSAAQVLRTTTTDGVTPATAQRRGRIPSPSPSRLKQPHATTSTRPTATCIATKRPSTTTSEVTSTPAITVKPLVVSAIPSPKPNNVPAAAISRLLKQPTPKVGLSLRMPATGPSSESVTDCKESAMSLTSTGVVQPLMRCRSRPGIESSATGPMRASGRALAPRPHTTGIELMSARVQNATTASRSASKLRAPSPAQRSTANSTISQTRAVPKQLVAVRPRSVSSVVRVGLSARPETTSSFTSPPNGPNIKRELLPLGRKSPAPVRKSLPVVPLAPQRVSGRVLPTRRN